MAAHEQITIKTEDSPESASPVAGAVAPDGQTLKNEKHGPENSILAQKVENLRPGDVITFRESGTQYFVKERVGEHFKVLIIGRSRIPREGTLTIEFLLICLKLDDIADITPYAEQSDTVH